MNPLGTLSTLLSKPNFIPPGVNQGLAAVRNPNPQHLDILPLETSVTGGRSIWAFVRTGFLELQERFFEEVTAAVVWLWGVKFFEKQYKKALQKVKPNLNIDLDWSTQRWKSLDLSPVERYTKNALETSSTLKYKFLGSALSIGASLFLVAIAIPWLNQRKTEWLIKHFYQNKKSSNPNNQPGLNPAAKPVSRLIPITGTAAAMAQPNAGMYPQLPLQQPLPQTPQRVHGVQVPQSSIQNSTLPHELLRNAYGGDTRLYGADGATARPMQTRATRFGTNLNGNPNNHPSYLNVPPGLHFGQSFPQQVSTPAVSTPSSDNLNNRSNGFSLDSLPLLSPQFQAQPSSGGIPTTHHPGIAPAALRFGGGFGMSSLGASVGRNVLEGAARLGALKSNVDYGDILVVDFGIAGGRSYMGAKRSFYEGFEYLNRDVVSLYFYLLSKPHLMFLFNLMALSALGTSIRLDPAMVNQFESRMGEFIKKNQSPNGMVSSDAIKQFMVGETHPAMAQLLSTENAMLQLANGMRTVHEPETFWKWLQGELQEQLQHHNPTQGPQATEKLLGQLRTKLGDGPIDAQKLTTLIDTLRTSGGLEVQGLSREVVEDITARSLKYSYRYTAGLDSNGFLQTLKGHFTPEDWEALAPGLSQRTERLAKRESMDLVNTALKRIQHMLPDTSATVLDPHIQWLEKAAIGKLTPGDYMEDSLRGILNALHGNDHVRAAVTLSPQLHEALNALEAQLSQGNPSGLTQRLDDIEQHLSEILKTSLRPRVKKEFQQGLTALQELRGLLPKTTENIANFEELLKQSLQEALASLTHETPLIGEYQGEVQRLLTQGAKFFSTETGPLGKATGLKDLLDETLAGGIVRDKAFERLGLRLTSALDDNAQGFFHATPNPEGTLSGLRRFFNGILKPYGNKSRAMQGAIGEFTQFLEKALNGVLKEGQQIPAEKVLETLGQYANRSRNTNAIALILALVGSALGLGLLVPKFQYWVTRILTGKNEHPGIAAVEHQHGLDGNGQPTVGNPSPLHSRSSSHKTPHPWVNATFNPDAFLFKELQQGPSL